MATNKYSGYPLCEAAGLSVSAHLVQKTISAADVEAHLQKEGYYTDREGHLYKDNFQALIAADVAAKMDKELTMSDVEFFKLEDGLCLEEILTQPRDSRLWISVGVANRILAERGTVVVGKKLKDSGLTDEHRNGWIFNEEKVWPGADDSTHAALLIDIKPIAKPDTAESLLRELVDSDSINWNPFLKRAKALLESK